VMQHDPVDRAASPSEERIITSYRPE
jgi:hypothetical protein